MLEKLSARNGMKAPNRLDILTLTVRGSGTVTDSMGPHAVLVRLAVSGSNARSMVNLTSFPSKGVPSWHDRPSCSASVYSSPSSLTDQDLATCG